MGGNTQPSLARDTPFPLALLLSFGDNAHRMGASFLALATPQFGVSRCLPHEGHTQHDSTGPKSSAPNNSFIGP